MNTYFSVLEAANQVKSVDNSYSYVDNGAMESVDSTNRDYRAYLAGEGCTARLAAAYKAGHHRRYVQYYE